jgi:ubiquinone/menaquinone biosynthesis C-methylase UbiE
MVTRTDTKNNTKRADLAISLIENNNPKVLELGTGDGELFLKLSAKGLDITGADICPNEGLLRNKHRVIKHDLNNGLPFKNNSFDVVIALEVLEHLYNPYAMMKEIKRVLKPSGYAIIAMPNTASWISRIGQVYERRLNKLDIYWHHYQPSITSIRNLVSTELKIEDEIFLGGFRRLSFFNPLMKVLIKISKNAFCGDMIVKARKLD